MLNTSHGARRQQVSQDAEHLPEPLGKAPGDVLSYSESVWKHLFMSDTREPAERDCPLSERRRKVRRGTELKEEGKVRVQERLE